MMQGFQAIINSPIGKLGINIEKDLLIGIQFLSPAYQEIKPTCSFSKEIVRQLNAYFDKSLRTFTLPIETYGSNFANGVYELVKAIPFGQTATYSDVAKKIATGARAVGNACRFNPIPIVIPCHRVVAKNGLGGYSGALTGPIFKIKSYLLQHEDE